ncbi:hypothetical protein JVU11DRAFT_7086 [Chiua virens]|nr:hypothetical protein JVU11DRAFT_7086 [Chiua virens]
MTAKVHKTLAVRGIRSFDDKQVLVIEFFSPIIVIVGHNGSGKTTIIECLKYATTGDQPPNTRGGAFVHDPKMANEKEVKAQVKSRFHAANGQRMLVVRKLSVTAKKTGLSMKTLESILGLADSNAEKGSKRGVISTKCAEMDAEIPHLLGVSKSVLENVIFYRQKESWWPLAEPAALKKFDNIFEATRYTKALDSIKSLRKDRVAGLKADKERLESLSKQKAQTLWLRTRIVDLNDTITSKQLQYEECKAKYEELVKNNAHFYESATRFREVYVKVENLQQKKEHYQQELAEVRETAEEIEGSDEEPQSRLRNFDENIAKQKHNRRQHESERQDFEDELARARRTHVEFINEHGELAAEAKRQAQHQRIHYNIIIYVNHSPLECEKVNEFIYRLGDLQRKQRSEYEKLQSEIRGKNGQFNRKSRQLHTELESLKLQVNKSCVTLLLREKLHEAMSKAETAVETMQGLAGLSLQADAPARLDLKRAEKRSRKLEITTMLELCNPKFRKLVGKDALPANMEREIDHVSRDKEHELAETESELATFSKTLQAAETSLSQAKSQLKSKQDELKQVEKYLKENKLGDIPLNDALEEAREAVKDFTSTTSNRAGMVGVYETFLKVGKAKKTY